MKTKAGEFRQDVYDELNQYGIDLISDFLRNKGFVVEDKEEDYTIDIEAFFKDKLYRIEAEVRSDLYFTDRHSFPYDTVSFLGRKRKYEVLSDFWYFLICKQTGWAVFCNSDTIYQEEYKKQIHVNNQYRYGKDLFYRVPKMLCRFENLNLIK